MFEIMQQEPTCNPLCLACSNVMDFPREILISPGVAMDRKQHENSNSSHHELISRQIWSSIFNNQKFKFSANLT